MYNLFLIFINLLFTAYLNQPVDWEPTNNEVGCKLNAVEQCKHNPICQPLNVEINSIIYYYYYSYNYYFNISRLLTCVSSSFVDDSIALMLKYNIT